MRPRAVLAAAGRARSVAEHLGDEGDGHAIRLFKNPRHLESVTAAEVAFSTPGGVGEPLEF
jgi:hypothetical protein